jgi:16S rRNA (uracil1498-N3)-methyltransferase
MRQFILPVDYPGTRITLTGKDSHYLLQVLRMKEGDTFPARAGTGRTYRAKIEKAYPRTCEISLTPLLQQEDAGAGTEIILVQAIPKGKTMDLIVRQSVECGVSKIIPVTSEHSVVRIKGGKETEKQLRWEKIAKEAMQQCGTGLFPVITPVQDMEKIPAPEKEYSLGLFFHQLPLENYPLHRYLSSNIKRLYIAVGPEGGFSEKEIDIFRSKGYKPIFLGKNVLRTETAVVYILGSVHTLIVEQQAWNAVE